jgi:hypothetical protein
MSQEVIYTSETTGVKTRVYFQLVDGTDGITGKTGQTGTCKISKNGGATATSSGSIVEIDSTNMPGRYYVTLVAGEYDTLGTVVVRYKAAGTAEMVAQATVVAYDPYAAPSTPAQIADEFLVRNAKGGSDGPAAQSVAAALAGGFMDFAIVAGVLTVKYSDGTTAFTRTLTRDATLALGAILSGA